MLPGCELPYTGYKALASLTTEELPGNLFWSLKIFGTIEKHFYNSYFPVVNNCKIDYMGRISYNDHLKQMIAI